MSVYLVRSLLLSFFIGIIVTVCYYFLKEELNVPQVVKFKKAVKTYSIEFTAQASGTSFTQQQQAFKDGLQKNIQVTSERLRAAKIAGKTRLKNDSSYTISVNGIKDTISVRDLVFSNGRLGFYEVYTLQDLVDQFKDLPTDLFSYLSPAQPYQDAFAKAAFPAHIGICKLEDSGRVRSFFSQPGNLSRFPADIQFMFGEPNTKTSSTPYVFFYAIRKNPDPLTNRYISSAEADYNESNQPTLNFMFNAAGTMRWERMTGKNIGKPIAICINDKVISAPTVISKISGGNSRLNISESMEQCRIMAVLLTSEDLLLPARITKSRVSADLVFPTEALSPLMNYILAFCVSFGLSFCIIWFIFKPGKNARANP